jgi:signal transduction histidine kinase
MRLRTALVGPGAASLAGALPRHLDGVVLSASEAVAAALTGEVSLVISDDPGALDAVVDAGAGALTCMLCAPGDIPNGHVPLRCGTEAALQAAMAVLSALAGQLIAARVRWWAERREADATLYAVAHDLKSQLQGMVGLAGLLTEVEAERLSAEGADWCQRIEGSGEQLARLIDALLSFLRAGTAELRRAVVSGEELVRDAWATACAGQPEGFAGRLVVAGRPAEIRADQALLGRALAELFDNAARHAGRADPTVTVSWSPGDARAPGAAPRPGVTLRVHDDGVGIPPAERERIFEPFHRGLGSQRPGVGLAIVRRVVERDDGVAWVSEPRDAEGGAAICLYLPNA